MTQAEIERLLNDFENAAMSLGGAVATGSAYSVRDRLRVERAAAKAALLAAIEQRESQYNELIMAVARKFPGETRHQTALRYIQNAESTHPGCASPTGEKHEHS